VITDPFMSSDAVAKWAAGVLSARGIDDVAKWRMLEYWVQVELYRAIEAGTAGAWRSLGEYEQPYFTDLPRSGSKTNTKWVDLVIAEPTLDSPTRIAWIELKDIGRSHRTLAANAKGLGNDFAALWSLRPLQTQQTWLNPPDHVIDRWRLSEWNAYGPCMLNARHLIAQIVITPKSTWQFISPAEMEGLWLGAFEQRTKSKRMEAGVLIARQDTRLFSVHAVVHHLPTKG
jgi:hypothetical protein